MRQRSLIAVILGMIFIAVGTIAAHADETCTRANVFSGASCQYVSGGIDGNQVVLHGTETTPGSDGNDGSTGGGDAAEEPYSVPMDYSCAAILPCAPGTPPANDPAPGVPALTIRDLAAFHPATPSIRNEPSGWAVIGLDTNFLLGSDQPVLSGSLLGRSAQVRFIPVGSVWDYGDGATRTAATTGATWQQLGLAEFSPTDTSHVYRERADYTVRGSVVLAAEYRFAGGPWLPVSGTLTIPAPPLALAAWHVKTVLVDNP